MLQDIMWASLNANSFNFLANFEIFRLRCILICSTIIHCVLSSVVVYIYPLQLSNTISFPYRRSLNIVFLDR